MGSVRQPFSLRRRVFEIIETATFDDHISRIYDIWNMLSIIINLTVSIMYTFEAMRLRYGPTLLLIESITVAFFAVDYVLRVWTAKFLYPKLKEPKAILRYIFSFTGIIDLLSFLMYYLPVVLPVGAATFRMLRVIRILRLFRVNAYYDSLNVITEVIYSKAQQIISSVFLIMVLLLASSLFMYSLEHEAQPDVFNNAFSGIWWAVSTLLTIGYGDIYPITTMGKMFSIVVTFLGVGMVAIPTGIISAGFVDQYSRIKRLSEYAHEEDVHFIKIHLTSGDRWAGKMIQELGLPAGVLVAVIQRGGETLVPRGDVVLLPEDTVVLGAAPFDDDTHINLKEVVLRQQSPWNGQKIRDLDISRQTIIIMVKRKDQVLIPKGDLVLLEGDKLLLYSQSHISNANVIQI